VGLFVDVVCALLEMCLYNVWLYVLVNVWCVCMCVWGNSLSLFIVCTMCVCVCYLFHLGVSPYVDPRLRVWSCSCVRVCVSVGKYLYVYV